MKIIRQYLTAFFRLFFGADAGQRREKSNNYYLYED
jgi:hypothetical protein